LLPVLIADRNLQIAHEVLNQLQDLEDFLGTIPMPVALHNLRRTIAQHRRVIFFLAIWKLQNLTGFQS